jgi:septal ring-binding cell division protein DamX
LLRRFASLPLLIVLCLTIGAGFLVSAPTQAALDPVALSCPNRQTTFLAGGGAQPGSSLIAYLRTRPVAGGSVGPAGTWSIPLKPNERPGIYDVEVRLRGSLTLVASFTCYIDVPLDVTETPEPGSPAPEEPTTEATAAPGLPSPSATVAAPTATAATRTTTAGTATRTTTAGTATRTTTAGTATRTTTAGTATRTVTGTTTTTTGTGTPTTTTEAAANVKINDVVCREPTDDPTFEYIELVNNESSEVTVTGWKIVNTSQGNATFTFPTFTIEAGPDIYIVVYGGIGTNRPDIGEFYWGNNNQIWHIGDRVELRNASNTLVTSLTVPADSCS